MLYKTQRSLVIPREERSTVGEALYSPIRGLFSLDTKLITELF